MNSIQSSRRQGIVLTEEKLSVLNCTNSTHASLEDSAYDSDSTNSISSSPLPLSKVGKKAFDFRKSPRKRTDPGAFSLYDLIKKPTHELKARVEAGDKGILPLTHTAMKIELHGQSYLYMEVTIDSTLEFDLELKDIQSDVLVDRCNYVMVPDNKRVNHHNIHITFPTASDYVFTVLGKRPYEASFSPRLTYMIKGTGANTAARTAACYKMRASAVTHGASAISAPEKALKMQFRIPSKVTLLVDYRYGNQEKVPHEPIFQRGEGNNVDVLLTFPKKGGYKLKILGQTQGEYVFRKLFEYTISDAVATPVENLPPKMWSPLSHFPSSIYSPVNGTLMPGSLTRFKLRVKDAVAIKVIGNNTVGHLRRSEEDNELFEGSVIFNLLPVNGTLMPGSLTRFKLRVKDAVAIKVIGNNTVGHLRRSEEDNELFEGSVIIGEFSSGAVNVMAKFYDKSEEYVPIAAYNVTALEKKSHQQEKARLERKEMYSNMIKQEVQRKIEVKVEEIKREEKRVEVSDYVRDCQGHINTPSLYHLAKEDAHSFSIALPTATEVCLSYGSQWIKLNQNAAGDWTGNRTFKIKTRTELKIFARVNEEPGKYKKIAQYCLI
eukprot:CAMPEP_0115046224 /NCGR_PEP_ID=MMETSP0216-20121206/48626_1 /TAXON_ID=223996 /ORGANISM="Protocruzia adherens, Strain Boccale" /LENGTH=604 /DNA_ID=CAMNT_0002429273 /DNA_START=148 /DNA_END=1963 /DNA_ORIENTATION=+